ncbi:hypothetical protein KSF_065500 [Reticulibacter mediterranei]|uniref:Uncharacterized protein n=1 Tax=Reticulibacter mediterranei TaxID=2778369 RepID=A0A8J3N2Z8_9CHLR|nr:hypothetical protein KSF_065500 [Reticulibacter mediterranei]
MAMLEELYTKDAIAQEPPSYEYVTAIEVELSHKTYSPERISSWSLSHITRQYSTVYALASCPL